MSRDDFSACTPFQFKNIYDAYMDRVKLEDRQAWERCRLLALCTVQPHSKKTLKPSDIITFEWDKVAKRREVTTLRSTQEDFEAAKKRYGC